jgi:rubrerythrin
MRTVDADALEKEGWSLHRDIQVDKNTREYQTKPLRQVPTIEPRCETCEAFNKTRLLIPQPERKKGRWLFKERREPVYDISGVKTWGIAYMCPECGFIHTVIEDFGQYVYCPNCGAEMREDGESDESD